MTCRVKRLALVLSLFSLSGFGIPLFGSMFLKIDLRTLVGMSEAIVRARVSDIHSYWNSEKTMIFTDVTLDILQKYRGGAEKKVVVRVPGGTVDGFTVEVGGAPQFQDGTEVLVFLSRWKDGARMVAGYSEGVSRIVSDRAGNRILKGGLRDGISIPSLLTEIEKTER